MGNDAKEVEANMKEAISNLNEKIAQHAAIEDERFAKTVKDLAAARAAATAAVTGATNIMKAEILETKNTLKKVEGKVIAQIQDVSAMVVSDTAAQHKKNKIVESELARLFKKADTDFSSSKRARGKLKAILDENNRIAHDEVQELFESTKVTLEKVEQEQIEHLSGFASDLTSATTGLYEKLAADKTAQANVIAGMTAALDTAKAASAAELKEAKELFASPSCPSSTLSLLTSTGSRTSWPRRP